MRRVILSIVIGLGLIWAAQAGTTCTRYGNQVYCTSSGGGTSSSYQCAQYGNQVYCN